MVHVEPGSGDFVVAATAKYEIRRRTFAYIFSVGKRHLILRGGREKVSNGGERRNARGKGGYYCYR